MTVITKSAALFGLALTLSACGGTTTDGGGPSNPSSDPIVSQGAVGSFTGNNRNARDLRETPVLADIPDGNFTYNGRFLTALNVTGDNSINGLYGRIAVNADLGGFANDAAVTLTEIHTLDDDEPIELLSGSLIGSGRFNGTTKELSTNLSGTLVGDMGDDGESGRINFTGAVAGNSRDIGTSRFPADARAMTGALSGTFSGSEQGSFAGQFYAYR